MPLRTKLLLCLLGVLVFIGFIKLFMGNDGLVTLDFTNASLAKVIKALEWQVGKKVLTDADPNLPITIHLNRMPAIEAVDALAVKVGGYARMVYLGAPNGPTLLKGMKAFKGASDPKGWKVFSPFASPMVKLGQGGDPRELQWELTDPGDRSLHAYLNEAAQKSGMTFAVPESWNPTLGTLPREGTTRTHAAAIMTTGGGWKQRVFLITVRPPRSELEEGNGLTNFPSAWPEMNPQWIAERIQAQIAQLPAEERPPVRKMAAETQALWAAMKDLSPEERRTRMAEYFNRPDVQEAMDERMARRDGLSTPEQVEQRFRNYLLLKQAIKASPPSQP